MTQVGTPLAARTETVNPSFVEWSAVLAGAVLAAALSFVFLTFGAAIGLSATSPWPNSGVSVKVVASLAIFWALAQQIGSLMAGGYVAGRMRTRWYEAGHEAEFRDGLHGGLVWAVGVLISAFLVFATAGLAARTAADLAGKAASSGDAMDVVIDTMLRPTTAQAGPPPAPAGAAAPRRAASNAHMGDETRAEISRILAASVTKGSLSTENRTYLAQLVAQRTGLSQQEAERRVDAAVTAAREAADKARRAAALTGFVTAAGLILSFGAAWWAALKGGQHRDTSIPARFHFGPRRPVRPTT
jgi:hypothetical protein